MKQLVSERKYKMLNDLNLDQALEAVTSISFFGSRAKICSGVHRFMIDMYDFFQQLIICLCF